MKKILPVFSYIFHPLFIPVYATLFYFFITRNFFYRHEIYLVFIQVLILTILLPISLFYLLKSLGLIRSKMMLDKKERKLPLVFYSLLLLFLIKYSFAVFVIPELYYYFTGTLISTVLALALVLFHHKASLHVGGIASLTVFIISISAYYHIRFLYLIAFFVLCTGMVASSRLEAKAHTMGEVVLGALVGIVPQVALWYFWLIPSL
ncbi:hypothetical protein CHU92_10755 [Flavobacterium cyanobacteriorum]|uniref:Phosphatidic acid phosphatase type 2/haloperoxidase domain-containing protein n=1 Tax=Flavobacterium cyanobacteriorum TaxID=2022802 RepID=A0A255Z471_9FLAO|nr:hypothetical protein [Flavobacterium cyanobacteriorum]OYQ35685.1 hypothetical protein CHU92_10755 [Flavobacterium cyanobacteriorum]